MKHLRRWILFLQKVMSNKLKKNFGKQYKLKLNSNQLYWQIIKIIIIQIIRQLIAQDHKLNLLSEIRAIIRRVKINNLYWNSWVLISLLHSSNKLILRTSRHLIWAQRICLVSLPTILSFQKANFNKNDMIANFVFFMKQIIKIFFVYY